MRRQGFHTVVHLLPLLRYLRLFFWSWLFAGNRFLKRFNFFPFSPVVS